MKRVYRPLVFAGGLLCLLLPSLDPAAAIVRKAASSDLDALSRSTSGIWDDRQVRVNINDTCNAYWSPPGGFNGFFQEGFDSDIPALCYNEGKVASATFDGTDNALSWGPSQTPRATPCCATTVIVPPATAPSPPSRASISRIRTSPISRATPTGWRLWAAPAANACYSDLSNCTVPFAGMRVFADGFESGDVSAWSGSVP